MQRAFVAKFRNRGNLIITTIVPPSLAALIGWALYFTDDESGKYDFASAFHIPTYIFISLLVAMFLALMNSVDDIIRDRVVLHRERNLDVRLPYYIFAKFTTLALFSAVQCALFVLVGNSILEIRGMFWEYFGWMLVTTASGTSLGLLISAVSTSAKMASNIVPLVLIPQLIFGGALIKYEEMNRDLDMIYTFQRWFKTHHEERRADDNKDAQLHVPMISRFIATHYSYEALIVAQAKLNPLALRQGQLQEQIDVLVEKSPRSEADAARLEDLKDTLAMLSGMESGSKADLEKRLRRVDRIIDGGLLDSGGLKSKANGITADRLYTNQKVSDLVAKAETEQSDYRRSQVVNVFFSPEKQFHVSFLGKAKTFHFTVYAFNTFVLLGSSFVLLCAVYAILKRQLRTRGI
jgi:hypothetical protein